MYELTEHERIDFAYWFSPPGSWSAVRGGEVMRYWRVLREAPWEVVLQHGSGAIAVLRLDGDKIVEARLDEGAAAERWLRDIGFPVGDELRHLAAAALVPGREIAAAIQQLQPLRWGLVELAGGTPTLRRWRVAWGGVFEVTLGPGGTVLSYRVRTGGAALDCIEASVLHKRFDVPTWGPQPIEARTRDEAKYFVVVQKSTLLAERMHDGHYELVAHSPEGARKFVFALTQPTETGLGTGRSPALDPVELVLFARRVVSELPANVAALTGVRRTRWHEKLGHAVTALREAQRFVDRGADMPRVDVCRTVITRRYLETHPERFHRSALEAEARRLAELQATLER